MTSVSEEELEHRRLERHLSLLLRPPWRPRRAALHLRSLGIRNAPAAKMMSSSSPLRGRCASTLAPAEEVSAASSPLLASSAEEAPKKQHAGRKELQELS